MTQEVIIETDDWKIGECRELRVFDRTLLDSWGMIMLRVLTVGTLLSSFLLFLGCGKKVDAPVHQNPQTPFVAKEYHYKSEPDESPTEIRPQAGRLFLLFPDGKVVSCTQ